jgi:hypothetical protein
MIRGGGKGKGKAKKEMMRYIQTGLNNFQNEIQNENNNGKFEYENDNTVRDILNYLLTYKRSNDDERLDQVLYFLKRYSNEIIPVLTGNNSKNLKKKKK